MTRQDALRAPLNPSGRTSATRRVPGGWAGLIRPLIGSSAALNRGHLAMPLPETSAGVEVGGPRRPSDHLHKTSVAAQRGICRQQGDLFFGRLRH